MYLALNMTSIVLMITGSSLSMFSLMTLSATGCGLLIQGYITKSNLSDKLQCKFKYQSRKNSHTDNFVFERCAIRRSHTLI